MSKVYKHDEEIKEENGIFLKGYKVSYYYNDQIKETYTYLNNINIQDIQESHEKERESDASESDASLNDVSLNEEQKDEKKREQKEGIECNNINVKELLKAITSDNKNHDGLCLNATEETNKNIANINKKQTSKMTTSSSSANEYDQYIKQFYIKKGETGSSGLSFTHTRIPSQEHGVSGGTFCIPPEKLPEFWSKYSKHVITNRRHEYLTEKQLQNGGPILVDLDFR